MKNVAIIFDCLYGGGAERIAGLLSVHLAPRFNVYLFLERTDNIVYDYAGEIVDCGSTGTEYMEYNVLIAKKKYHIDYSISFMEFFNYINIKTKTNDKVIISERCNLNYIVPRNYYDSIMVKHLYRYADHIVAISNGVKKEIVTRCGIGEDRVSTIYNYINQKKIIQYSKQTDIEYKMYPNTKLVVCIGRLEEQKNHKRLINQFKKLYIQDSSYRLIIIGSGSLYSDLIGVISDLQLNDIVTIMPYMDNPFLVLKKADVFVLSSKYEGLGNVLLEAMCLGIPVVSTNCPSGPMELLSDTLDYEHTVVDSWIRCERGILVSLNEKEDTTYLADSIKYMTENQEYRRYVIENQKVYMENYSEQRITDAWLNVIDKVDENEPVELHSEKEFKNVIYGAGEYCRVLIEEMKENHRDIYAIMVSDIENNPLEVMGIPVYTVDQLCKEREAINVILGVYDFDTINQMCRVLEMYGFENVERPMMYPKFE